MFLIQSSQDDASTADVIDWVRFLYPQLLVLRLDDATEIKKINYRVSNSEERLELKGTDNVSVDTGQIKSWWYRRGYWEIKVPLADVSSKECRPISIAAKTYLDQEFTDLEHSIDESLSTLTKSINKYSDNATNKLSNLSLAASLQLNIPETLVTNDVFELETFLIKHHCVITKALSHNFFQVNFASNLIAGFAADTSLVTLDDVARLKGHYKDLMPLPAFYQKYIDKKFELRIFFLNDRMYSMAIFSQANEKTRLDFRNYDDQRPNRCVPYSLPEEIANKLKRFMRRLKMKSGSIDMIVSPANDYVFLEVNPIGKYQWLRQNCNYDIDREIAKYLAENA